MAALGALLLAPLVRAQLSDMMFTVGTTTRDAAGKDCAYVVWQFTQPDQLPQSVFAVYAKPGDATAAGSYERKSIVYLQTTPAVLKVMLNRAAALGDDLALLEDRLNSLFGNLMPSPSLGLEDKLAFVIQAAVIDPEQYDNLLNLARLHPAVNLCLGVAYADLLTVPGKTTFEVRLFNLSAQQDISVVGRVTVEAGLPVVLPAPGAPVAMPATNALGHLNVKLRWATPEPLRRLSLMSYGFHVYRMTKAFADANNYPAAPPSPATLVQLARVNPNVRRINSLPVLADKAFGADVGDFTADPETFFVADDNNRFGVGGAPFLDGDQFYYFVTACDLLGRDGAVSTGTLVTLCDRLPPLPPDAVQVVNDYVYDGSTAQQRLKIVWQQLGDPGPQGAMRYYVYRWDNPSDAAAWAGDPTAHRVGAVNHLPGAPDNSYVDLGMVDPPLAGQPSQTGKTVWYTVRAAELTACGTNLSANTGPVYGVLRDRQGPPAPAGGRARLNCVQPEVAPNDLSSVAEADLNPAVAYFRLVCSREHPRVAWAEFYVAATNFPVCRRYFASTETEVTCDFAIPRGTLQSLPFLCRVASDNGTVSTFTVNNASLPATDRRRSVNFRASLVTGAQGDCDFHDPTPNTPGDNLVPIDIQMPLTPGTKEYRLYRSVDGGRQTLIAQGPADYDTSPTKLISLQDGDLPVNASELCYYIQYFDEHGNPSPRTLVQCVKSGGHRPLPKPTLLPIESLGDPANSKMRISWFCPPNGVDRFEVWVARDGVPSVISSQLSSNVAPAQNLKKVPDPTGPALHFNIYRSGHVGGDFGNGAEFSVDAETEPGKTNTIFVVALGVDGKSGPSSNVERYAWILTTPALQQVPWPARSLPAVNSNYAAGIYAVRLNSACMDRIGIRIGQTVVRSFEGPTQLCAPPYYVNSTNNPLDYLYRNPTNDRPVLPCVLYRTQVPNAVFPTVSGDIVQVAPMMEKIAYSKFDQSPFGPIAFINDPFIAVISDELGGGLFEPLVPPMPGQHGIYLLDTTPLIRKAAYRYFLLRFGVDGEIEQVVPTNVIDLNLTP